MVTQTELVMHNKRREVLEQELKDKVRELIYHMNTSSFLLPLDRLGPDGPTFIMYGPVKELQQLSARNLR